ncbi:MAG: RidA family protein [Pelagimonas sp.]|jgi:reactive intermediate/imine deaminase|uniref:RidA family protein n=1 Tax=Pelagimonas sp. TaxID=2073170 RepID=UPI003D6A4585
MKFVSTNQAAPPGGHYSQAVVANGVAYLSGILPVGIRGDMNPGLSFAEQAALVLRHATEILRDAGSGLDRVVKSTVFVTNIEDWGVFDTLYAETFRSHRPARAVVPVPGLHHGFLVELDMIALVTPR